MQRTISQSISLNFKQGSSTKVMQYYRQYSLYLPSTQARMNQFDSACSVHHLIIIIISVY